MMAWWTRKKEPEQAPGPEFEPFPDYRVGDDVSDRIKPSTFFLVDRASKSMRFCVFDAGRCIYVGSLIEFRDFIKAAAWQKLRQNGDG